MVRPPWQLTGDEPRQAVAVSCVISAVALVMLKSGVPSARLTPTPPFTIKEMTAQMTETANPAEASFLVTPFSSPGAHVRLCRAAQRGDDILVLRTNQARCRRIVAH